MNLWIRMALSLLQLLLLCPSGIVSVVEASEPTQILRITQHSNITTNPSSSPSRSLAPTISLSPTTIPPPTQSPSNSSSVVPTAAPGNTTDSPAPSFPPSIVPTTLAPVTPPPTHVPTVTPTAKPTVAPTVAPTSKPTLAPTSIKPTVAPTPHKKEHPSLLRIIGKTIAWMCILALALLGFGFIMNNRYRIYYFARGAWYRFLQWPCTLWILRKTGFGRGWQEDNLNEIIFENDLHEGLLLQDT